MMMIRLTHQIPPRFLCQVWREQFEIQSVSETMLTDERLRDDLAPLAEAPVSGIACRRVRDGGYSSIHAFARCRGRRCLRVRDHRDAAEARAQGVRWLGRYQSLAICVRVSQLLLRDTARPQRLCAWPRPMSSELFGA